MLSLEKVGRVCFRLFRHVFGLYVGANILAGKNARIGKLFGDASHKVDLRDR